jgi:hypothetical protein
VVSLAKGLMSPERGESPLLRAVSVDPGKKTRGGVSREEEGREGVSASWMTVLDILLSSALTFIFPFTQPRPRPGPTSSPLPLFPLFTWKFTLLWALGLALVLVLVLLLRPAPPSPAEDGFLLGFRLRPYQFPPFEPLMLLFE